VTEQNINELLNIAKCVAALIVVSRYLAQIILWTTECPPFPIHSQASQLT